MAVTGLVVVEVVVEVVEVIPSGIEIPWVPVILGVLGTRLLLYFIGRKKKSQRSDREVASYGSLINDPWRDLY